MFDNVRNRIKNSGDLPVSGEIINTLYYSDNTFSYNNNNSGDFVAKCWINNKTQINYINYDLISGNNNFSFADTLPLIVYINTGSSGVCPSGDLDIPITGEPYEFYWLTSSVFTSGNMSIPNKPFFNYMVF